MGECELCKASAAAQAAARACVMDVHFREKDGVSKDTDSAPPVPAPAPAGTCPALAAVRATDGAEGADKAARQTCVEIATCGDPARPPASGVEAHASRDRLKNEKALFAIVLFVYVCGIHVCVLVLLMFLAHFEHERNDLSATSATSQADLAACRAEQAAHTEAVAQRLLAIAGALRGVAAAAGV